MIPTHLSRTWKLSPAFGALGLGGMAMLAAFVAGAPPPMSAGGDGQLARFEACADIDADGVAAVSSLVRDRSAAASRRLDHALIYLKRARELCRGGNARAAKAIYSNIESLRDEVEIASARQP